MTSTAAMDAVEQLAGSLVPELDGIAAVMARVIHDEMEDLEDDLLAETEQSCRANIGLICAMLRDGLEPAGTIPPAEALHYARECVRRGVPMQALLRAYRIGHASFWQAWLERLTAAHRDEHELMAEVVAFSSAWFFGYVDAVAGPLGDEYANERERWVRSAAALRADEVKAILEGRPVDEERASRRLRYELGRHHAAFVVWVEADLETDTTMATFERVASELAGTLGCSDPLLVPLGRMMLAGWVGSRGDLDVAAAAALRSPDAHAAGARIAIGEAGEGVDGFRRSHEEALVARRVARLSCRAQGTAVRYGDVVLTALLTADLDQARLFVERELGLLFEDDDATRRLAATLRVFLDEGSSFVRAARRLGVHENTVAYRVRRATELLGHRSDERQLQLRAALMLADTVRRAAQAPA